jgi:subtilisin family serine protease
MRGRITGVVVSDLPVSQSYLDQLRSSGLRLRQKSRWLNAASGVVSAAGLVPLARLPFVSRVTPLGRGRRIEPGGEPDPLLKPPYRVPAQLPGAGQEPGPEFYGFSYTQNLTLQIPTLHARGYTGAGVIVGVLDGGFRPLHASLCSLNVIDQYDFVNDDSVVINEPGDYIDAHDHGTSVWSVLAGYWPGVLVGPAYGASFLLAKTEDAVPSHESPVEEDNWIAAIEWMEERGVDVTNTSLGYYDWYSYRDMDGDTAPITIAADAAAARGVIIVTSAGNEGSTSSPPDPDAVPITYYMGAPADGDSVIAVGAADSQGRRDILSSHGPTFDGRIKPDVMAQGSGIAAADADGDSLLATTGRGTSFSSPLVAGVVALILEAHPGWNPMQVLEALKATADRSNNNVAGEPDNDYGWGYVKGADAEAYDPSTEHAGIVRFFNYPNPFSSRTTFRCELTESRDGRIVIYTLAGTLVRELRVTILNSTTVEAVWDGRNEDGRIVAAAVYLAVIDLGGLQDSTMAVRVP